MKKINITEEQKNNLCNKIAELAFELQKDENVECVYFVPVLYSNNSEYPRLDLIVIEKYPLGDRDKKIENQTIEEFNKLYEEKENKEKYGTGIFVFVDSRHKYSIASTHVTEIKRANDLYNSTILFDKTGYYSKIKKYSEIRAIKFPECIYKYSNLVKFHPPIKKEVEKQYKNFKKYN